MYADQTGLFPAVLSLGNNYVMILHPLLGWRQCETNQVVNSSLHMPVLYPGCDAGDSSPNIKYLTIKHQQSTRPPLRHPTWLMNLVASIAILVIVALSFRRFYHVVGTIAKTVPCAKRVPIRKLRLPVWYCLCRKSILYDIFLFCKAHCTLNK